MTERRRLRDVHSKQLHKAHPAGTGTPAQTGTPEDGTRLTDQAIESSEE